MGGLAGELSGSSVWRSLRDSAWPCCMRGKDFCWAEKSPVASVTAHGPRAMRRKSEFRQAKRAELFVRVWNESARD